MTVFVPELYLRLLGERELARRPDAKRGIRGGSPLREAAEALSLMGVISSRLGWEITSDYAIAGLVAQESDQLAHRQDLRVPPEEDVPAPAPVTPPLSFILDRELPLRGGRLRAQTLTLTTDGGQLRGEYISDTDLQRTATGPPHLSIGLPSGQRVLAGFSGGWGDRRGSGNFSFQAAIDPDIAWIKIGDIRIDLPDRAEPVSMQIDALPAERRAVRLLWQLIAGFNQRHNHSGLSDRAAVDALVHAGLVDRQDPELAALLWVADALAAQDRGMPLRHRRRMGGAAPVPTGPVPDAVPAHWRSVLLSPVTGAGPEGAIALAVATPVFDHVSIALTAMRCDADSTTLEMRATNTIFGRRGRRAPSAWWAEDDRGNHYLGESGAWRGDGNDINSGEIELGPLDPRARELTVSIVTLDARASLAISLTPLHSEDRG